MSQQQSTKKSLYIAILNMGDIRTELAQLERYWQKSDSYNIHIEHSTDKPIAHNRNGIVQRFLKTDYDYLMMLDGDIIPPADVFRIADYLSDDDKDVIGALCYAHRLKETEQGVIPHIMPLALMEETIEDKKEKYVQRENIPMEGIAVDLDKVDLPDEHDKVMYKLPDVNRQDGLIEVDAVGTGCILMTREVVEDIPHPFTDYFNEKGLRILGLDLSFCRRAKERGYRVWVHLDYACGHYNPQNLKIIYDSLVPTDGKLKPGFLVPPEYGMRQEPKTNTSTDKSNNK